MLKEIDPINEWTYGQRIAVGKCFEKSKNDLEIFNSVFKELHSIEPKLKDIAKFAPYFQKIADGLKYWLDAEAKMLVREPSTKEKNAGIKELYESIGEYGTLTTLAEKYSKDPDEILQWKYSKVFGILYSDLKKAIYQEKLQKEYAK